MLFEVEVSPKLRQSEVLRRHMDLAKYVDLLHSSTLYFRRADKFSDRFEGALTPAIRNLLNYPGAPAPEDGDADGYYRHAREGGYLSCWTRSSADNMALWQLYGGAASSLAVTTTVGRLLSAAGTWVDQTSVHLVRYIDHFKNPPMVVGHYTDVLECKHKAYSFEKEVRVIVSKHRGEWQKNPIELRLPIPDINAFVSSVIVAPEAGDWFFNCVIEVTRRLGVKAPVYRSKLASLPE